MSRLPARLLTLALAAARSPRRRPPAGQPVRRILIAHYLLLGDTLLLAPLLARLARRYPQAERVVLARPAVAPLFAGQPYGARALAYDPRDFSTFRALLAAGPFDLAFVLGDNRYGWLARAAGARWIVGFAGDRPAWKNWMIDAPRDFPATPAAWADMAAGLCDGLGVATGGEMNDDMIAVADDELPPFAPGDWPAPPAADFAQPATAYAVLHVGASTPLKLWPSERWRALADTLRGRGLVPVWSAGAGEGALVDAIDPARRDPRHCGTLSLPQLWRLLAGARLLICPDTGVAHLGKLVGVPTVALFGPGAPDIYGKGRFWRNAPFVALAEDPFACRDQPLLFRRTLPWVRRCGRGPAACPTPGACMRAIPLAAVERAALRFLDGQPG